MSSCCLMDLGGLNWVWDEAAFVTVWFALFEWARKSFKV